MKYSGNLVFDKDSRTIQVDRFDLTCDEAGNIAEVDFDFLADFGPDWGSWIKCDKAFRTGDNFESRVTPIRSSDGRLAGDCRIIFTRLEVDKQGVYVKGLWIEDVEGEVESYEFSGVLEE